jgi:hypothetical protein
VEYAVREQIARVGGVQMGRLMGTADTLQEARRLVPRSADRRLPPQEGDDPVIVEVWV